jgi:hypothetical protein
MPTTFNWTTGDPIRFVEIVSQNYAVARGGGVKNFFNVYHFRRLTTVNVLNKTNIESQFNTVVMGPILAFLNVDFTQIQNTVRFFENPADAPLAVSRTGVGAITGDRLPDFNAAVIQLKSGSRGKNGRGSKHLGPVAESSTTGDDLTSGAVTLATAVGTAIVAGFTDSDGNGWIPGLKAAAREGLPWHYIFPLPTVTGWTDVGSFVINKSLGTMKRRKIKTVT